jgi:hypothetical protein
MTTILLNLLLPHALELIGVALTLLIGFVAAKVSAWTGVQIEARHREALHSALMTGIRTAVARGLPMQQAVDLAIGYARDSVPDALARLKPSDVTLHNLARAKLQEATAAPAADR